MGPLAEPPASRRRVFATGAIAGSAAVVVQLAARVTGGVPTYPELVQDRILLGVPGPLFAFALEQLHFFAKPLFFVSLLALQAAICGLMALAMVRMHRTVAVAAAAWALATIVLLPLAGQPPLNGSAGFAMVTALTLATYLAVLAWLWRASVSQPAALPAPSMPSTMPGPGASVLTRREAFGAFGLVAIAAVLARQVIGAVPRYSTRGSGLPEAITPTNRFYTIAKDVRPPEIKAEQWRLEVSGLVEHSLSLRYDELRALPSEEFVQTLECISNEIGGDLISTGRFRGVPLSTVLDQAGVQPAARVAHFISADDYTETMLLDQARAAHVFLVYELNGAPLPREHGFPLRVLGAGTFGMKNPKWLTQIEIADSAPLGFWEQRGWTNQPVVQTMARIDEPSGGQVAGGEVALAGIAYTGDRGVQRVEVSLDDGATWEPAAIDPPLSALSWVFWRHLRTLPAGSYRVLVRATDGTGAVQTPQRTGTFPRGATGYHGIRLRVW